MKRLQGLWPEIITFENLYAAWRRARKGKSKRPAVCRFALELEDQLWLLHQQLSDGSYCPGEYRQFTLYERKPRFISAAPFRDRVIHHAFMAHIEPPIDRRFYYHSYACRQEKGTHKAVDYYQRCARRYAYVLKLDVSRYFPSIDHTILKSQLRQHIACQPTLNLLDRVIDKSPYSLNTGTQKLFEGDDLLTVCERKRGIPIGNLSSQFFANLYLNGLDYHIKQALQIPRYMRYVDDLFLFHDNKETLWDAAEEIANVLGALRLELHPAKIQLRQTTERVDVLGYIISRHRRWLRNENGHRFARRLQAMTKQYNQGYADFDDFKPSVHSWIGHAAHGETFGLRKKVFYENIFKRGRAN